MKASDVGLSERNASDAVFECVCINFLVLVLGSDNQFSSDVALHVDPLVPSWSHRCGLNARS